MARNVNIDEQIEALDATATTTTSQVFDQITQTDGLVAATPKLATSLVMEGLAATADTKISAANTLGQALANLQGQIDSMDLSAVGAEGSVITSVSEADASDSADAVSGPRESIPDSSCEESDSVR